MATHAQRHVREKQDLFIHEELMLLALRNEEGTVISSSTVVYALAGALMADLLMEGRVELVDSKTQRVRLTEGEPLGSPVLDECLERIEKEKKPRTLKEWVLKFVQLKKLKHRVVMRLVARRIVHADEATVLLFFKQKIYPQTDPAPERRIVERLRRAIFRGSRDVAPRTAVLISLAKTTGLLHHLFDKRDLRERKDRIKEIVQGEAMGRAAGEAARAAHAATVAAVAAITAASAATTAAASSR